MATIHKGASLVPTKTEIVAGWMPRQRWYHGKGHDPVAMVHDFEVYRRADIRFHIGLAEAADSPRLVTAMTEVQGRMSELITRIAHPPEVLTHSNDQHRQLVRLLRRRDKLRAVRLIREHIEGTEYILMGLL